MRKVVLILILIAFGAKYGVDYLFSDEFQAYGDRTKAGWTCQVNYFIGEYFNVLSRYRTSRVYFQKIMERCPETPIAERAHFEFARALENQGLRRDAVVAYEEYATKYAGTKRGRLAGKSADILKSS